MGWTEISGECALISYSHVPKEINDGPYDIGLVKLREGPRVLARFSNLDSHSLSLGMPLKLRPVSINKDKYSYELSVPS